MIFPGRAHTESERVFDGLEKKLTNLRVGVVMNVNEEKGTVDIQWLDYPGTHPDVSIPQSCIGSYEMPMKGTVVLVGYRPGPIAEILSYLPLGFASKKESSEIPNLKEGEKLWQTFSGYDENNPIPTGTEIYMNKNGDVCITTAFGEFWQINRDDNLIIQSSMNWEVENEGGRLIWGLAKREATDETGTYDKVITVNNIPLRFGGQALTECKIDVFERADATPGIDKDANAIVSIKLGNKLDDDGNQITSEDDNEVCIDIRTKSDIGFSFVVDKEGNLILRTSKVQILADTIEIGKDGATMRASARKGDMTSHTCAITGTTVPGCIGSSFLTDYTGKNCSENVKVSD